METKEIFSSFMRTKVKRKTEGTNLPGKKSPKKPGTHVDTRIRRIPRRSWEDFKAYCKDESIKRGKHVSANAMLLEMIEMVIAQNYKSL